jgi:hypothetical protein
MLSRGYVTCAVVGSTGAAGFFAVCYNSYILQCLLRWRGVLYYMVRLADDNYKGYLLVYKLTLSHKYIYIYIYIHIYNNA